VTTHPHTPVFSDTPTFIQRYKDYGERMRTDVISATDWLGNSFAVGDTVLYCIGAGRGQMMAVGTIQQMRALERTNNRRWGGERDEAGRPIFEPLPNTWEVEVQVLTAKTSGSFDNAKRTRPAWVNPMNITALPLTPESVK
jgi:hypothetical protein